MQKSLETLALDLASIAALSGLPETDNGYLSYKLRNLRTSVSLVIKECEGKAK